MKILYEKYREILRLLLTPRQNIFIECSTDHVASMCSSEFYEFFQTHVEPVEHIRRVSPSVFSYGSGDDRSFLSVVTKWKVREGYTRGCSNLTIVQFEDIEERNGKSESTTQSAESSTATESTTSAESPTATNERA